MRSRWPARWRGSSGSRHRARDSGEPDASGPNSSSTCVPMSPCSAAGRLLNQRLHERLRRLHLRWHVDVIYERYSLWGFAGLMFAREQGVPFVLEVNAPLRLEQARFRTLHNAVLAEALESQLFELADRVVVPSSALREYVIERGARAGRVRVVPNAADPTFFRPPSGANGRRAAEDTFV